MSKILSYQVSLRSAFHVVMSATISGLKRRSVRPDLQLFVCERMSYLRYLCLFAYSGVQQNKRKTQNNINRMNGALLQTTGGKNCQHRLQRTNKNKTQYLLDTTIRKQTQIT
jgi:hypothetical protein